MRICSEVCVWCRDSVLRDRSRSGAAAPFESFDRAESYYATLLHEVTHWTRHPSRMGREFRRKRWGDEGYAAEELVAELGAAYLCADLGITPEPREDHGSRELHRQLALGLEERRTTGAIFTAAAHAQRAADYQHGLCRNDRCGKELHYVTATGVKATSFTSGAASSCSNLVNSMMPDVGRSSAGVTSFDMMKSFFARAKVPSRSYHTPDKRTGRSRSNSISVCTNTCPSTIRPDFIF